MAQREKGQIERDRVEISKLYCKGLSQHEIAEQLTVTRDIVCYDLSIIRKQWQDSTLLDFNAKKGEELAKIDHLELTYWQSWERSLKPKKSKRLKAKGQTADTLTGVEREEKEEQRDGNPAYLTGVQWCINKRCDLLGLNAPLKLDIDNLPKFIFKISDQPVESESFYVS